MDIKQLVEESHQNSKDHGWHDKERTFGDEIALIHSELSEALEEFRKGDPPNQIYIYDEPERRNEYPEPEGVPIELADVLIRVFDMCGKYNIDIEAALDAKMKYNKNRTYRHGNKLL